MDTNGGGIVAKTHDDKIWYKCPECDREFAMSQRENKWQGKKMRCPHCGEENCEKRFYMTNEYILQSFSEAINRQIEKRLLEEILAKSIFDDGEKQ